MSSMKGEYKIATSIDKSSLDHEIASVDLWGFRIPAFSVKMMLYWFAVCLIGMFMVTRSWIASAGWLWMILFIIWYATVALYFGRTTRTGELKLMQLVPLMEYLPRRQREVLTRTTSKPSGFLGITGIRDISDDGLIEFLDGSIGRLYSVVGSASLLLFDSDRAKILTRVDNFWRAVPPGTDWITLTVWEPQRVYRQEMACWRQRQRLLYSDPDLESLIEESYDVLSQEVGGKYNSLHQYMLLKSKDADGLRLAHNRLLGEARSSQLMFKRVEMMDSADAVTEVLRGVYASPSTTMAAGEKS